MKKRKVVSFTCAFVCVMWGLVGPVGAQDTSDESRRPISLDRLLRYADDHAPALIVARARKATVLADQGAADLFMVRNPNISITAGPRFTDADRDMDMQFGIQQPLEIAGEGGLRSDVSNHSKRRLAADVAAVRWEVHREVHATYHLASIARARIALAEQIAAFQTQLAEAAERRVNAGDASPLVTRLALVEVAQAKQEVRAAKQQALSFGLRLAELAGWKEGPVIVPSTHAVRERPLPEVERLLHLARENQPGLAARAAAIREAKSRLELAEREGWPEPSLGVRLAREGAPGGGEVEWLFLGTLTLPIPTWQRNQKDVGHAEGSLGFVEAQYETFASSIETRVRRLASEVNTAEASVRAYEADVLPHFEKNLTLLRRSFELGEIDFLRLSTARERMLSARLDALSAKATYFTALANLEAFLGAHPWGNEEHHGGENER